LIASKAEGRSASDALRKIPGCIRERCAELQLTVADVVKKPQLA
jgi:hypothetical protein